jgi:hypothetical protein
MASSSHSAKAHNILEAWALLDRFIYNEIGKSCMTVAVKACAKKKDAKSDMT